MSQFNIKLSLGKEKKMFNTCKGEIVTKSMETALAAHTKKGKQNKSGKQKKTEKSSSLTKEECNNCRRPGHTTNDCFSKGGGEEAEALWKKKKEKKPEVAMVAVANNKENDLFAFTCTSHFSDVAESSNLPKSKYGTCLDSRASNDCSPDWTKFSNYCEVNRDITTADGQTLKVVGMGDLHLDLPNGSKQMQAVFKDAVHAPKMHLLSSQLANWINQATKLFFISNSALYQTRKDLP